MFSSLQRRERNRCDRATCAFNTFLIHVSSTLTLFLNGAPESLRTDLWAASLAHKFICVPNCKAFSPGKLSVYQYFYLKLPSKALFIDSFKVCTAK